MLAQQLKWEPRLRLANRDAVVTGDTLDEEEVARAPTAPEERARDPLRRKPIAVWIYEDPDDCDGKCKGACKRYFETEEEVFTKEKVYLGLRAFRLVHMQPQHAAEDPLLAGMGDAPLPRLVLLDVARENTTTLAGSKLTASRVYSALKKTTSRFYRERLDGVVKKHLKILAELDKLAQARQRVQEQLTLTDDDRRMDKLERELEELRESEQDLQRDVEDLWDLTLAGL